MISEQIQSITSIVHNEFYIKSGNGPWIQRNIFENVEYDEYENKQIEILQQKVEEKGLKINLKRSTLLKMLMAAQYDVERAIINCQLHLKFMKEYKKSDFQKDLMKGYLYVCGFDNQYRPVIIFRQYCDIKIITYFLETVRRFLLIDYYVENWTIIIDLELDLPVLELEDLLYLQLQFYGNLNKMLIINGPDDIQVILKQFTDKFPDLSVKLQVITEYSQLLQYIPKDQLEIKYGGDQPNVIQFWPIQKREGISGLVNGNNNKTSHLSIVSLNSSSVNKKSSFMKITVLEENGNPLLNQQMAVFEDKVLQSSESSIQDQAPLQDYEEKYKSYLSTSTKKNCIDKVQFMDMDDQSGEEQQSKEGQNEKKKKRKLQMDEKQVKIQRIKMEGEKESIVANPSCCSKNCSIF
ncbi:unnamed protein product [Paramecium octaurelia]|uniref:CRAL-TRIO domain-containing protein n=1 Tax=Paramecium octaurelia TaxID=43137 RepID=A0A8S1T5A8_PAROT|nr:unnamed protein product [Paramecium octaurelia]